MKTSLTGSSSSGGGGPGWFEEDPQRSHNLEKKVAIQLGGEENENDDPPFKPFVKSARSRCVNSPPGLVDAFWRRCSASFPASFVLRPSFVHDLAVRTREGVDPGKSEVQSTTPQNR